MIPIRMNSGPVVFLALLILLMAIFLGLLLTATEVFNPQQASEQAIAYATQRALEAEIRRFQLGLTATPWAEQAAYQQLEAESSWAATQTPQAATTEAIAVPVRQTATRAAEESLEEQFQARATQTAIENEVQMTRIASAAVATSIAHSADIEATRLATDARARQAMIILQNAERMALLALLVVSILGVIIVCCAASYWLLSRSRAYGKSVRIRTEWTGNGDRQRLSLGPHTRTRPHRYSRIPQRES